MKNFIKILPVLACVLILTACTNPFKKAEEGQKVAQERIYSCDDLKNETAREACMQQASSFALYALNSEIVETFDNKRCVELPQEMANECVRLIQESGVQGPLSAEQLQTLNDIMNPLFEVPEGAQGSEVQGETYYDLGKCATFTVPGLKEYCEKELNKLIDQVAMIKIFESGDVAKCDELKNEMLKNNCKIQLGVVPMEGEQQDDEATELVMPPANPMGAETTDLGATTNPVTEDLPDNTVMP